jgi:hypothetical protein
VLLVDETRRRSRFVPLGLLAIGLPLALAAVVVALAPGRDLVAIGALAGLSLLTLAWFVLGVRLTARDGDTIEVRAASGRSRVPAKGCEVALLRGGSTRSPHYDVILQPSRGAALRLARLELLGIARAPAMARRIAAALDVRVDERSVGELEAQLAHAAQLRRGSWRWMAGVLAVGVVASIVSQLLAADTMATLEVRCPGGKVTEGSATMLDGLRMTTDPGPHTFELYPASGPPFTQRVELVAGQTTVLDCSARPAPAPGAPPRPAAPR